MAVRAEQRRSEDALVLCVFGDHSGAPECKRLVEKKITNGETPDLCSFTFFVRLALNLCRLARFEGAYVFAVRASFPAMFVGGSFFTYRVRISQSAQRQSRVMRSALSLWHVFPGCFSVPRAQELPSANVHINAMGRSFAQLEQCEEETAPTNLFPGGADCFAWLLDRTNLSCH